MNDTIENIVVNTTNPLTQYTTYLQEQGKSANTIKSYTYDIGIFFDYFKLQPTILLRDQIIQYKEYLQKVKNMNAKSINRALSSLKSYNEFLIREGYMENLVVMSMDYIKVQKQLISPTNVTIGEAIKFMNRIKQNEVVRNYHIVILFLNSGIRISELTNIKLTDIFLNKKKLIVFGKGSKQREIPLNDIAIEIIQDAIKNRENYGYALNVLNSPYLFLSKKSEKLDTGTIERIFNKYSNKITPHKLRHVWATNFLKNGGDLKAAQQILGHSSLSTTQIYLHPTQDDMRNSMNNCGVR